MDVQTQRRWSKPELVVIARSQPEEAVLTACKGDGAITNAGGKNGDCFSQTGHAPCVNIASS